MRYVYLLICAFITLSAAVSGLQAEGFEFGVNISTFQFRNYQYNRDRKNDEIFLNKVTDPKISVQSGDDSFKRNALELPVFLRYTGKNHLYTLYAGYSETNWAGEYGSTSIFLPLPILGSTTAMKYRRSDAQLRGTYFLLPGSLGIGAGIRRINSVETSSTTGSLYSLSVREEKESFIHQGPELNGVFRFQPASFLTIRLSLYYFNLRGAYQNEGSYFQLATLTPIAAGASSNEFTITRSPPGVTTSRIGEEGNLEFSFRLNAHLNFNLGLSHQVSRVTIDNFHIDSFSLFNGSNVNPITYSILSKAVSELIDPFFYGKTHKDEFSRVYLGFSVVL